MEEEKKAETFEQNEHEIKVFKKAFTSFMVGQILLMISLFGNATIINGVPQWLAILFLFELVAYGFYLNFLIKVRLFNDSFRKAYLSFLVYLVISLLTLFGSKSTDRTIVMVVRGLDYSIIIIRCVFYLYFFHGCYLFFNKHGFKTGTKRARVALIVFLSLYVTWVVIEQLSGMRLLLTNYFFSRFFMLGKWVMLLAVYAFILAVVLSASRYMKIKLKERGTKDGE